MSSASQAQINQALVNQVVTISQEAGKAIMAVYQSSRDMEINYKADDSPLTQADLAAHRVLVAALPQLLPIPIVSEESVLPDFAERSDWARYWLIDPLDGTKEFINRNGEFTVNVALIENGRPILGVVHVPAQSITYTGAQGLGAAKWQAEHSAPITIRPLTQRSERQVLQVVASRRHGSEALQQLLAKLRRQWADINTISMGSSLKFCVVAEGVADIYPRLAPTSEWDTAAAQAVVEAAGGAVVDTELRPLRYNQKADILNPHFYVLGDTGMNWAQFLR